MTTIKAGDKAPAIHATDQNGQTVSLDQFRGKKVILYFYPKDDTPGCTVEACNLRDNYTALQEKGFEIMGVSTDSAKSHQKFIDKYDLPFSLIADTEKEVVKSYGVWGLKKFMGREYEGTHRVTFVIDGEGVVEHVFDKVDTKNHTEQILKACGY
jgi:peroxiredoxin Q/BCP